MRELLHTEDYEGFKIDFYVRDEDINPRDMFDTPDIDDIIEKINNGDLLWFCAEVTASKKGIVLGNDFLGGCCEENYLDFLNNPCYPDMKAGAAREAQETLKSLLESES
jgi:hypothetical protein